MSHTTNDRTESRPIQALTLVVITVLSLLYVMGAASQDTKKLQYPDRVSHLPGPPPIIVNGLVVGKRLFNLLFDIGADKSVVRADYVPHECTGNSIVNKFLAQLLASILYHYLRLLLFVGPYFSAIVVLRLFIRRQMYMSRAAIPVLPTRLRLSSVVCDVENLWKNVR